MVLLLDYLSVHLVYIIYDCDAIKLYIVDIYNDLCGPQIHFVRIYWWVTSSSTATALPKLTHHSEPTRPSAVPFKIQNGLPVQTWLPKGKFSCVILGHSGYQTEDQGKHRALPLLYTTNSSPKYWMAPDNSTAKVSLSCLVVDNKSLEHDVRTTEFRDRFMLLKTKSFSILQSAFEPKVSD